MAGWLDRVGTTLLDATLAATAITGLVILAMLQCRQPARRLVWSRAGLLATLVLVPLAALNPVERIDLRGSITAFFHSGSSECRRSVPPRGVANPGLEPADPWQVPGTLQSPETRISRRVAHGVVVAYLLGLMMALGWLGLGLAGVFGLIRSGTFPSAQVVELYESLPLSARSVRPLLMISGRVSRPVLIGVHRAVILIPPELENPDSVDRLRLCLLHELAHVENRDHYFRPVASLAESVWFFLPTFWWIRDQLKLDQEFLADRWAVAHFGTSNRYASSLLGIAGPQKTHPVIEAKPEVAALPSRVPEAASALVQRIQMLLKCPFPIEGETPVWWRWSTALTLALATLAASCLTLRGLETEWGSSSAAAHDLVRTFELADLVLEPRSGRSVPFELHYRLPGEFVLSLEVLAPADQLGGMDVIGHALARSGQPTVASLTGPTWHRVQIRRLQGFDFVEVDDLAWSSALVPEEVNIWLTLRPLPTGTTRIRNLKIEW